MSQLPQLGAGRPSTTRPPAGRVDGQILITWQAVLAKPDPDAARLIGFLREHLGSITSHS